MSALPKFLFIDDSPAVLDGLRRQLHAFHPIWDLTFCQNVVEAIEYINTYSFDAVITDINMPNIDGEVLVNLIHSLPNGPAVVILSGAACENDLRANLNGPFEFLEKPCDTQALVGAISNAVQRKYDKNAQVNEEVLAILVRKLKLYGMVEDSDLPESYNARLSLKTIATLLTDCFTPYERPN